MCNICMPSACRGQRKALDPLELELELLTVMWVLRIDPHKKLVGSLGGWFVCLLVTGFHCIALAGCELPLFRPG